MAGSCHSEIRWGGNLGLYGNRSRKRPRDGRDARSCAYPRGAQACAGVVPRGVRRYPCALRGDDRGGRARLAPCEPRRVGYGGVRDASRLDGPACAARAGEPQGPLDGDRASHWPKLAHRYQPPRPRRVYGYGGLRCNSGRRRYAYRGGDRRLGGTARCPHGVGRGRKDRASAAYGPGSRGFDGRSGRLRAARPRLPRGFSC